MAPNAGHRPKIQEFLIPAEGKAMEEQVWARIEPKVVWYGVPQEQVYPHPKGGTYVRCRVEAFDSRRSSLGFLPLPLRYKEPWIQLCYTIVYWLNEWRAWVHRVSLEGPGRGMTRNAVRAAANNSGTRFLQYLLIRRLIIDELLKHDTLHQEDIKLLIFDEYLIRERMCWIWTKYEDIPVGDMVWLMRDPVHPTNAPLFGKASVSDEKVSPQNENPATDMKADGLDVPVEFFPPPLSPGRTGGWIWGNITHFDFGENFVKRVGDLISLYSHRSLKKHTGEMPYEAGATYPKRWHETHEPPVVFLSEEEDLRFNHVRAPIPGSLAVKEASMQGHQAGPSNQRASSNDGPMSAKAVKRGIIDNEHTRAIVEALADPGGPLGIKDALQALETALGEEYDEKAWVNMLDAVMPEKDEWSVCTVDDAFKLYGGGEREEGGVLGHEEIMQRYREDQNRLLLA